MLRKSVREKVRAEVLKEHEEAKRSGRYPWEGIWLSPAVISDAQKRLKKRDRTVFVELTLLLAVITAVLLVLNQLVFSIIPGQKYYTKGDMTIFSEKQSPDAPSIRDTGQAMDADKTIHAGKEEGAPDARPDSPFIAESIQTQHMDSSMAVPTSEKQGNPAEVIGNIHSQKALPRYWKMLYQKKPDQSKKYYVQIGAWQNMRYAVKTVQNVNVQHPDVLIEYADNLYRVKIPDILNEKEGALILKELRANFNLNARLVKAEE
jgi:hypothetical protein